jgi:hypothetical protein
MNIFNIKNKAILLLPAAFLFLMFTNNTGNNERDFIWQQVPLGGNNINTWIFNTGIFNQDLTYTNHPGFQWPAGSGKYAVFTTGLSIAGYVNGQLREAMASYAGEYGNGYVVDSAGIPRPRVDSRFKFYSVKRTDNWINNPDWLNWGLMIPFGAPYVDVNNSGYYEPTIDTPGVRGAENTLFICLTDGFIETHSSGEGFGGGTLPLFAELHLTAWCYNKSGLEDVQFLKWVVINKNNSTWDSTYFSIICDPDLGFANDDYIGCDSIRNMGYCYNGDNDDDENQPYSYGINPPAVGFDLLLGVENRHINPYVVYEMTSFGHFKGTSVPGPTCESDPNGETFPAYQFMRGFKKDGTPWLNPIFTPPRKTKYCYSGDPETNTGWTEYTGKINNCNGDTTGIVVPSPVGDKRFLMSSGSGNLKINPGDTQTIMIAQFIARGTSNLNSVTKLKQLDDFIQAFVDNGFVIGVEPISNNVTDKFLLFQNYPNPFNPNTRIKFSIPPLKRARRMSARIVIYDILGREITTLVPPLRGGREGLSSGTYEVSWDASNYPSGVYFYKLTTDDASITKKMVLLK